MCAERLIQSQAGSFYISRLINVLLHRAYCRLMFLLLLQSSLTYHCCFFLVSLPFRYGSLGIFFRFQIFLIEFGAVLLVVEGLVFGLSFFFGKDFF